MAITALDMLLLCDLMTPNDKVPCDNVNPGNFLWEFSIVLAGRPDSAEVGVKCFYTMNMHHSCETGPNQGHTSF